MIVTISGIAIISLLLSLIFRVSITCYLYVYAMGLLSGFCKEGFLIRDVISYEDASCRPGCMPL